LRLQGVREIEGDFLVDLSYFRPARTDVGQMPFDEAPEFRYNVIPDALLLNTYLIDLDIVARGEVVRMITSPALEGVSVVADFTLVERDCEDWEDGWKIPAVSAFAERRGHDQGRGEFPRECTATTAINVIDRIAFADRLFRSLWTHMGGTFRGQPGKRRAGGLARRGPACLAAVVAGRRPTSTSDRTIRSRASCTSRSGRAPKRRGPRHRATRGARSARLARGPRHRPARPRARQRLGALAQRAHHARAACRSAARRAREPVGAGIRRELSHRGRGRRHAQAPGGTVPRCAGAHQDRARCAMQAPSRVLKDEPATRTWSWR
jgi:hypothetical protein